MAELQQYKSANGRFDQVLLRGAAGNLSPQELSDLTNGVIKPAAAAQRVRDILNSRDWLTQIERKQLLLDDLMRLKDMLYEKAVVFSNLDAAKPLLSVLTAISKELAADKIDLTDALTQIRRAHGQMMLSAISAALERSFLELERRHAGVPKSELLEVFQIALPEAVQSIEARIVEE